MSGGSWDYFCYKLEEVADRLTEEHCEYRRAFGQMLGRAAWAMHEIEWVDSCDKSAPADIDAIKAALGDNADSVALSVLLKDAEKIQEKISSVLASCAPNNTTQGEE